MSKSEFRQAAEKTVTYQLWSVIICFVTGIVITWIMVILFNNWELYWRDGERFYFGMLGWFGLFFSLIFMTYALVHDQFHRTFDDVKDLTEGIHTTLWINAVPIVGLSIAVFLGSNFITGIAALIFLISQALLISVAVSIIQLVRLWVENFNQAHHMWLVENESSLIACKRGELPYRHQVRQMWHTILFTLCMISFIALPILVFILNERIRTEGQFFITCAVIAVMCGFGAMRARTILKDPGITSMEGPVSLKQRYTVKITVHRLQVNRRMYRTDVFVYEGVTAFARYRFWYSHMGNRILAYESLDKAPLSQENIMPETHTHDDPLRPHTHNPNPKPPSKDPTFTVSWPDGSAQQITMIRLQLLPKTVIKDCYIVSTGHGTSGPFAFGGALLVDLLREYQPEGVTYAQIEVISGDGFGNRIMASELEREPGQFLLAYERDGLPLSRESGLVRLIVPSEVDDALRQVKWVGHINVLP